MGLDDGGKPCHRLFKDFTKPAEYTGELIGVEVLYRQTGKVLEDVSLDPDIHPDEAAAIQSLEEVDEGIEEDVEDPTVFQPDIPSTSAAARSGDPADAPRRRCRVLVASQDTSMS
ncbi:hypothetical protein CgunFtcFv8_024159 [Champsocephalus gunnari]|uniref:Uncharacterized protein n=1 Tax=Champsocephalus gunnari TaxID=52237 RepID=A0AAN8DLW4_CHAGU|nr:hypothetical protein CgunFtcFv8_024159 [Champsocephalus gunnari]